MKPGADDKLSQSSASTATAAASSSTATASTTRESAATPANTIALARFFRAQQEYDASQKHHDQQKSDAMLALLRGKVNPSHPKPFESN
jgi:hypothetical protein